VYFSHNSTSSLAHLAAYQAGSSNGALVRRQNNGDIDSDGGIVGTYDYFDEFESVFDEADTQGDSIGTTIANYMFSADMLVTCANIYNPTTNKFGLVGVTALGWNGDEFNFGSEGVGPYFSECENVF
jgi:hypothetical protein